MIIFLENVISVLFMRFFKQKVRNFSKLEKLEITMKKQRILKKTPSSFEKASLPKWEGGKYGKAY